MGQKGSRLDFEPVKFTAFRDALRKNAKPAAFISFDHKYITMNDAHAKFFGYKDEEEGLLHMKSPQQYSPEKQPDGRKSADAVMANALAVMKSKSGSVCFNWTHKCRAGKEKKVTVILTEMRYQSLYAFKVLFVPFDKYDNPLDEFAKELKVQSVLDCSPAMSTCMRKPIFDGKLSLFGMYFKKPVKKYFFLDCTGRNLFWFKKKGDKVAEGIIRIDDFTLVQGTEDVKRIQLSGKYRSTYFLTASSQKEAMKLKELIVGSVNRQIEQKKRKLSENVKDLVDQIEAGTLLRAFEMYYSDDCVMSENLNTSKRVGIHANRDYEQNFMSHVEWKAGRKAGRVMIDEEKGLSAIEWYFKFEVFGFKIDRSQVALAEWKDGKMVREDFYYTTVHDSEFPSYDTLVNQAKSSAGHDTAATEKLAQKVIDGFSNGEIVKTYKECYNDPDVVMTENGKARNGYQASLEYETGFMSHVKWIRKPVAKRVVVMGNLACVEWDFEFDAFGMHINRKQLAIQLWKDGKLLREDFYYDSPKVAAKTVPKALIVYAHPEEKSFCAAMRDQAKKSLESQGYIVKISDLYAKNFKAVAGRGDFKKVKEGEFFKLNNAQKDRNNLTDDIIEEQDLLQWCDLVVLVFPIWWVSCPAIMKGYIDRVFSSGWAYAYGKWFNTGLFPKKKAMVITSTGGPGAMYTNKKDTVQGELDMLLYPITHASLYFCGMDVRETFCAYSVEYVDDAARKKMLADLDKHMLALPPTNFKWGVKPPVKKTKKALIVYAHPEAKSFCGAMKDQTKKSLEEIGYDVTVSDLYEMKFEAVAGIGDFKKLDEKKFFKLNNAQKERDNLVEEIRKEQEKVEASDLVVFVFPIWWVSCPAILKGWIDRVFSSGWAYEYGKWFNTGLFSAKKAMVITATGGPLPMYTDKKDTVQGELDMLLYPITHASLYFVGMQVLKNFCAYSVEYVDDAARKKMLADLDEHVKKMEDIEFKWGVKPEKKKK